MEIRPLSTPNEVNQVVQLEIVAWDMEPIWAVPNHVLIAVAKNGGLLLGAFEVGKLIGFTLGWLGTIESSASRPATEHLKLVSHMMGVLPGYRDRGVGFRLKLAQREWALERGLDLITWTYDPLESRNANLNIRRLGSVCQTYLRDLYGSMADRVNVGIKSDRFQVDWWVNSRRVKARLSQIPTTTRADADAQLVNPSTQGPDGNPRPAERLASPGGARLLVEIPTDMQSIRRSDLALGVAWRAHTRAIFESAFEAGYRVCNFIYEGAPARPRGFYVLEWTRED